MPCPFFYHVHNARVFPDFRERERERKNLSRMNFDVWSLPAGLG